METENLNEQKEYGRILTIAYPHIARWLNLPPEFRILAIEPSMEHGGFLVKVQCPEEPQYEIPPFERVLFTAPSLKVMRGEEDFMMKPWWPGLGQEEPKEEPIHG